MLRRSFLTFGIAGLAAPNLVLRSARATGQPQAGNPFIVTYFEVPEIKGSRDVTDAGDGTIWVCGQRNGVLGRFDPRTGQTRVVPLGDGAAPHGVVRGPDGAARVTEGGQNAIARVDDKTFKVDLFRLPQGASAPISTPRSSTRPASSGSPARTASSAVSIPHRARWRSSTRRAAPAPTA